MFMISPDKKDIFNTTIFYYSGRYTKAGWWKLFFNVKLCLNSWLKWVVKGLRFYVNVPVEVAAATVSGRDYTRETGMKMILLNWDLMVIFSLWYYHQ